MRYIDISQLKAVAEDIGWEDIKKKHMQVIKEMTPSERKEYIDKHRDWNKFQKAMLELSHHKCWYSEAPIGSGDFEVDHFRPKNKAKEKANYRDPSSKSVVHKENGYWWLAYEYTNYRLAGGLINKIRRDRLKEEEETKGKGDYFPLDLSETGKVAADEENVNCEIPILLDPCVKEDVCLLTYDSNGEPISAGLNEYEDNRVLQSIFYYHLDLEQLNKERLMVWKDCEKEILRAKTIIDEAPDERAKRLALDQCLTNIVEYVKDSDRPYSCVVKACVMVYAELDGFVWLKRLVKSILL